MSDEPTEYQQPPEYPFEGADEARGYQLFPEVFEGDPLVFFHGTAAANLQPIMDQRFRPSPNLPSVSFAQNSGLALRYACESRSDASPDGVVIMVRYGRIDVPGIAQEGFGIHLYDLANQPEIIGYCIVPRTYIFR